MRGKYFNNPKPQKMNRRDSDKLIYATHQLDLLLSLVALRDEFDWGTKRLERFIDKRKALIDAHASGHVSATDLRNNLKEETGIFVDFV